MTARRGVAVLCLLVWVGLLLAGLLLGHRGASFSELKTAVAVDYVERVEVSGTLGDRAAGVEVVEVTWRRGLARFRTLVVEERPPGAAGAAVRDDDDVTAILDRPVADVLRGIDPGVTVTTASPRPGGPTVLGWATPVWADAVLLLAAAAMVWLLTTGPPPRRATRWGWFWLMLLIPLLGFLAHLLLSGVLSRRPAPTPTARPWLTGPKAFLIGAVVAGAVTSARLNDVFT